MALIEIQVPDIGDFDAVTVIELLVKPGDTVQAEQSLITVESDKASMEIPSSHAGVVQALRVQIGDQVKQGSVVLALESLLLATAVPLLVHSQIWGMWLAAMACGLQNAMVSTYSGSVVRTTHLSGMFTDLGIGLGHLIRGMPLPMRRLTLSGLIISGFLAGGILGAWAFGVWRYHALLIPSALTGLTGVGYASYRHWILLRQRRNDAPHAD